MQEHIPLAPFTTFGIGGPARWFAEARDERALLEAVRFARERGLPLFVLGGGSNLLVADEGFPGVVLHIALPGIEQKGDVFEAAAGENWDGFVSLAIERGYGGLECLAGIPGTVGGAPVQNVGAYGQEVSGTITSVRVLDLQHLNFSELPAAACGFAYRRSIFNSSHRGRFIVTRVHYRLRRNAHPVLSYPDLRRHFEGRVPGPTLAEAAEAVRAIRLAKGMLLVDGDPDCRSAGSFLKNPVVSEKVYGDIAAEANAPVPRFVAPHGFVKIPAAWLVEQAGFRKGFALGAAGISSRHTLALVNRGGATAKEILALRDRIVEGVDAKFHIRLETEPVWVGG
ncbi:MAG TPA: UDP-N-acetylmuramate dehydrogenase [Acidobacteriaceae bacterium]|nr:UDP-N-acetylmuramate dehydrogenase [Acidobacteriaceae bacterium]